MSSNNRNFSTSHIPAVFAASARPTGLCYHGIPDLMAVDGIPSFFKHSETFNPADIFKGMIKDAPVILKSTAAAQPTLKALAAIGTNVLLNPGLGRMKGTSAARLTAQVILMIETVFTAASRNAPMEEFIPENMKGKLKTDSRKRLVKFFSERIDCFCLGDEREAIKNDKEGMCSKCGKTSNDAKLFDCAACKLVKYCGKECQRKDWKRHKLTCKMVVDGRCLPEHEIKNT